MPKMSIELHPWLQFESHHRRWQSTTTMSPNCPICSALKGKQIKHKEPRESLQPPAYPFDNLLQNIHGRILKPKPAMLPQ